MVVGLLPGLVGAGLEPTLAERVDGWLRRRLTNPRRESNWAMWEIPGVALALLPSHGSGHIVALLDDIGPRMQPHERETWRSVEPAANHAAAFHQALSEWFRQDQEGGDPEPREPEQRDPTADVYVNRVMKRRGYKPANPDSPVYDSLADFEVREIVLDVSADEPLASEPLTGHNVLSCR